MITKNDWNDALDAWVAEEREGLGGPPSPDEVVAYLSGELSGAAAARIRALLVYYPELTPLLDERIEKPRRPSALRSYAIAATVAVALLTAALIRERRAEPAIPSSSHELNPFRARGPASAMTHEIPAGERHYLITAVPSAPPDADRYRIEIAGQSKVLWSADGVRPIDDIFVITVPGEFLKPGAYALNIYEGTRLIDRYAFRVVRR